MKKAWIENGLIRDVCQGNPSLLYHPDIAAHYNEQVPDNAENGDAWDGTILTKQPAPIQPPPASITPPKITKTHFLLTFTSAERVKARELRATDPILDDFWLILDGTDTVNLSLPSVQSGIEYTLQAVKAGGLTSLNVSMRKSEILSAILQ